MDSKTSKLLQDLSFPKESELHVARHLAELPERLSSRMSNTAQKNAKIYDGSIFSTVFISDTDQLIPRILEFGELTQLNNVNFKQLELEFTFPKDVFESGIRVNRYNTDKNMFSLVLILHRNKNKWEVTTSFPGEISLKKP